MFYLKPILRKVLSEPSEIKKAEGLGNDKDVLSYLSTLGKEKGAVIEVFEKHYGVKYVDLKKETIQYTDIDGWDLKKLRVQHVVPYNLDKGSSTHYFALSEIMNQKMKDDISKRSRSRGRSAKFHFSFQHEIEEKYAELDSTFVEPPKMLPNEEFDAENWVNEIIVAAIDKNASDIHIESLERGIQIRFRVDGMLTEKKVYPYDNSIASTILIRIKIISGMDISEKRKPQDGRLDNFNYNNNLYDFRVSSVKTIYGEKIVMRIFNKTSGVLSFEEIGFSSEDVEKIKRLLKNQNGIIYMAGATGSGKTTTLYTMIDEINSDEINIYTIEDPVEKTIKNVNQIQIDPLAGIDYANTLRALLRQDPDVMIVGEIRDTETADLSIRASLTGHLVLSTIHSNNAIDSISRLIDMEIEPYLLGASSIAFLSQRLVRKLCPYCKARVDHPTKEQQLWLNAQEKEYGVTLNDKASIFEPVGCSECNGGYKGRIAIVEILEVTDYVKDMIKDRKSNKEIRQGAMEEGFQPLISNALKVVENGTTSIGEVMKEI